MNDTKNPPTTQAPPDERPRIWMDWTWLRALCDQQLDAGEPQDPRDSWCADDGAGRIVCLEFRVNPSYGHDP